MNLAKIIAAGKKAASVSKPVPRTKSAVKASRKRAKHLKKSLSRSKARDQKLKGKEEVAKYRRSRKAKEQDQLGLQVGWGKDASDELHGNQLLQAEIRHLIDSYGDNWNRFPKKAKENIIKTEIEQWMRTN